MNIADKIYLTFVPHRAYNMSQDTGASSLKNNRRGQRDLRLSQADDVLWNLYKTFSRSVGISRI